MQNEAEQLQAQLGAQPAARTFNARAVLEAISKPRLTGTPAATEIAAALKRRLEEYGYTVHESGCTFSTWPGRFGVSLAGVCYLIGVLGGAALLYLRLPGIALVVLLALSLVIGAIATLAQSAINLVPWGRAQAVNLVAFVPNSRPRYCVMAHRDSKSQPIPLAFRGPAIVLAALAWLALVIAATAAMFDPIFNRDNITVILAAVSAACGLILVFCWVNNRSPGALDNASGVAALLGIAEREAAAGDVGFIITDAEELGLVGARAIAQHLPPTFGVINIDGLDDEGSFYLIERFGWPKKKGSAPHLAAALLGAADALDMPAHRRDVPVGVLLDHIPVVRAGTPALTVMRGSLASLRRVHRPADNLDQLKGEGVEQGIALISAALQLLRQQPH